MDALLQGNPRAVEALATEPAAWQPLLEHVILTRSEQAPAAFVEALLARDPSVRSWLDRAYEGATMVRHSEVFSTGLGALQHFRPWWLRGILADRDPRDVVALEARFEQHLHDPGEDTVGETTGLLDLVAEVVPGSALHAEALELVARRALETSQGALALASLEARLAMPDAPKMVTRLRGVALLLVGRIDEGLDLLEATLTEKLFFPLKGAQVLQWPDDPAERAIFNVCEVAVWASWTTPEWVRALGGWAETSGDARVKVVFLRELERMAAERPGDLAILVRQARQWGHEATAAEASVRLEALRGPVELPAEVDPDDVETFVGPFPSEEAALACVDRVLASVGRRRVERWELGRGIARAFLVEGGWWIHADRLLFDALQGSGKRFVGGLLVWHPDDQWGDATEAFPVELAWDPESWRFTVARVGERVCPLPTPEQIELALLAACVAAGGRPDVAHPRVCWFHEDEG